MRYLFFDIECCNGRDICEFGYIITDTSFAILEQKVITINPEAKFSLTGRRNAKDISLFFSEATYYASPKFSFYYDEIKNLIEFPNQIIIGHAISNDAKFLRTACQRYDLAPIDFRFNDSQKMYKEFFGETKNISLEDAGEKLAVDFPQYLHKSDEDAEQTMKLVKAMCTQLRVTLLELVEMCPTCSGESKNFKISYDDDENNTSAWIVAAKSASKNVIKKDRAQYFNHFLKNVMPQGEIAPSELNGKKVCISSNYEHYHFKEMLEIVQRIVNHGGKYQPKASDCDCFVAFDLIDEIGDSRPCARLKCVNDEIASGRAIEIISFEQLLKILGLSEEQLSSLPMPNIPSRNLQQISSPQHLTINLGELIKAAEKKKNG